MSAPAPTTVPIVSVVGKGDSGKTTFLEKLIRELAERGVRVATVKHHIHDYDIDATERLANMIRLAIGKGKAAPPT